MHDKIRILIVDDHRVFAESIAHRLRGESDIQIVGLTHDEAEAETILDERQEKSTWPCWTFGYQQVRQKG